VRSIFLALTVVLFATGVSAQETFDPLSDDLVEEEVSQSALVMPSSAEMIRLIDEPLATAPAQAEIESRSSLEDKLFRTTRWGMVGAKVVDFTITAIMMNKELKASWCPATDPDCLHPIVKTVTFHESGWVAKATRQTTPAGVVAVNAGMGLLQYFGTGWLHKKGGVWSKVAIGLNSMEVMANIDGSLHCLRSWRTAKRNLVPHGVANVIRW
jgi:hypothetical protein